MVNEEGGLTIFWSYYHEQEAARQGWKSQHVTDDELAERTNELRRICNWPELSWAEILRRAE